MNELKINIPEGIKITPELKKRIQLAALPEIAENYALSICEKYFGKKFKLASKNQHGYDIISECGTIKVEGNWTATGNGFTPTGGTVEFSGSVEQTISLASGNNFYDLKINNSNATEKVSAQGSALVVSNHLNITDGIFESASDYHDVTIATGSSLQLTGDITVSGNWTNNGTFIPGTHKVSFEGNSLQTVSGNNTFYRLKINKLSGEVSISGTILSLIT